VIGARNCITAAGNDASATLFSQNRDAVLDVQAMVHAGAVEASRLAGGQDIGSLEEFTAATNKVVCGESVGNAVGG
jgi:hypothetical protein